MSEFPQKDFYKLSEVCQYTDTQPYVLRFWESEFPQLGPGGRSSGGQRVYRKQDVDLVLRIKQLLYDEQCTIAGARSRLEQEQGNGRRGAPAGSLSGGGPPPWTAAEAPSSSHSGSRPAAPDPVAEAPEVEMVPRDRYEDAIDEIERLRFELREADKKSRKTEAALEKLDQTARQYRERSERAAASLEKLLDLLG